MSLLHCWRWCAICLVLGTGVPLMVEAQETAYVPREFRHGEQVLLYRWLTPPAAALSSGKKFPLVIFLHGAGERGADNRAQLRHCTSKFEEPANREQYPCFVIAPQCPTGKRWSEVDWSKDADPLPVDPSEPVSLLMKLLAQLEQEHPIDVDRIYLMGLSMGGYGTWDLLSRYPQKFAAAVPICGGGDEAQAVKFKHVPIWVFHGALDTAVKPIRSQRMVAALQEAGGNPRYTEYPDKAHDSWTPAMQEPELFPWLFAQRRPQTAE